MKLNRLIKSIQATTDSSGLGTIGEMVGNELPRNRLYLLRDARKALATTAPTQSTDYVQGYFMALRDVIAAYESAMESRIHNMLSNLDEALDWVGATNSPRESDEDV